MHKQESKTTSARFPTPRACAFRLPAPCSLPKFETAKQFIAQGARGLLPESVLEHFGETEWSAQRICAGWNSCLCLWMQSSGFWQWNTGGSR
ncbi:MAG: hypothetical protein F6J94_21930 [Moorea sp. SIO1F2]|uniref:hypothetical protein n=1 Tax=unclassified Moorena TaxID=2683338 RepID=UPI0013BB96F6|nr:MULTISPECIES: hypothetical protein [unclassified Moorena]NEN94617.1 hypothetical protein [Moorena sp. SIO3I7]NEO20440.1 hypothetical protein [Moorena sp. SIO4A5]NEP23439.1 hypothetical protein [Moorena sp. SIO3I6]NET84479.1 hypothetical protein [Moorena sp. SIO1F2]